MESPGVVAYEKPKRDAEQKSMPGEPMIKTARDGIALILNIGPLRLVP